MKVQDIMVRGAVTVAEDETIRDAVSLMRDQRVGMLVVSQGSKITGIVTDRDLLMRCVTTEEAIRTTDRLGPYASSPVITVSADHDVFEAARLMKQNGIKRLPVVSGGELVGVVSFSDIAQALQRPFLDILLGMTSPRHAASAVRIGTVVHYYTHLAVAVLDLGAPVRKGDRIHIAGHTTDIEQTITSMEINHQRVTSAEPGDSVAIKVVGRVRHGDAVYVQVAAPASRPAGDAPMPAAVVTD